MDPNGLAVEAGRAVAVSYRLELDGGVTLDKSPQPVWYVQGGEGFPPALQRALVGKHAGDAVIVALEAKDAFGERDEGLVMKLPRAQFKDAEPLALGERLEGRRPGLEVGCLVTALDAETVTVDFNPQLAGNAIVARLRVEEVRSSLP